MNPQQLELLLNQLFDCSLAINKAIKNNLSSELDNLLEIKDEKLKLIENNKKFINDFSQFNELIEKIKQQENENISLLSKQKNETYKNLQKTLSSAKIMKKYEQIENVNGAIVDVKE